MGQQSAALVTAPLRLTRAEDDTSIAALRETMYREIMLCASQSHNNSHVPCQVV